MNTCMYVMYMFLSNKWTMLTKLKDLFKLFVLQILSILDKKTASRGL